MHLHLRLLQVSNRDVWEGLLVLMSVCDEHFDPLVPSLDVLMLASVTSRETM